MPPGKICPKCGVVKDASNSNASNSKCRKCKSAETMAKYHSDPVFREKRKAYRREQGRIQSLDPAFRAEAARKAREKRAASKEWRDNANRIVRERRLQRIGAALAVQAKGRATRKGRAYSITQELVQGWWESDPHCAYCRVALVSSERTFCAQSATLDRVNQSLGYTPKNTVLACYRCNTLKRDATVEEIEALAVNLRRLINA